MMPGHADTLILIWIRFHSQQSVLQKSSKSSLTKSQDLRFSFNLSNQKKPAFPNQQKPTKKIDEFSTLDFAIARKRNDTAGWVWHRIAFSAPTWFTTLRSAVWSWFLQKLKPQQAGRTGLLCKSNATNEISRTRHRKQLFSIFHGCTFDSCHLQNKMREDT